MPARCRIRSSSRSAFTLIELLSVLAILAIIVGMMAIAFSGRRDAAKADRARADLHVIQQGLEAYRMRFGDYPRVPESAGDSVESRAIYLFNALNGRYGPTGQAVSGIAPMLNNSLLKLENGAQPLTEAVHNWINDPWGKAYVYDYPRASSEQYGYALYSRGPDKIAGNSDDVNAQ